MYNPAAAWHARDARFPARHDAGLNRQTRFIGERESSRAMRSLRLFPVLSALLCACAAAAAAVAVERPNILFIVVDDQSPFDLAAYEPGSPLRTPHIDRLAVEGTVFDGAYQMGSFSGAVCMPSRHMIMSGRTLWHLPPAPWGSRTSPPDLERNTIPAVFGRAGYATMRTCKVGNSYEAANRLFAVRHDAAKRGGDDESGSAWHAERVMDYLREREASRDRRPFLIYYGFSHPHDTRDGKPELLARYGAVNHVDPGAPPPLHPRQPRLPPNYLPAHPFRHGHDDVRDEMAVSGVWQRRDEATIRNEWGRQFACSENIDIQIGRVLAQLDAMGELGRTYVFYTADNGMAIGRHGLEGKQNLYQHTWRVPFIVKGPGVRGGARVRGNIYLLDVLATLCDLAGIPAPETNEGLSFRSVLEGRRDVIRDVLYGAYSGGSKPGIRCVLKDGWKLIQYEAYDGGTREVQLFDLSTNPYELVPEHRAAAVRALTGVAPAAHQTDLAEDPAHAAKLAEMRALLLAEMRRLDDPWRFLDQPSDNLPPPPPPPARRAKAKGKGGEGKGGKIGARAQPTVAPAVP